MASSSGRPQRPIGVRPSIHCSKPGFWARVCRSIERPELTDDERYDTLEKRRDAREEVNEIVSAFTRRHTVDELVEIFTAHEVPHAPILGVMEALSQPQAQAREMVVETDHKTLGRIPIVSRSIKFAGDRQPVPEAPPVLGQHTDEILQEILDLAPERIEALRSAKVVA